MEGEKLRRYEKEMFIYVAVPEKRLGYVGEFDASYSRLLLLMNDMLQPSSAVFNDEERKSMTEWHAVAVNYGNTFAGLARRAGALQIATMPIERRLGLTVEFNDAIRTAKDGFRTLLSGTDKMRKSKEAAAQRIAAEIDNTFYRLRMAVLAGGMLVIGLVIVMARGLNQTAAMGASPPTATR